MTSAAPDFSELLKYVHGILKVNKRFCTVCVTISNEVRTTAHIYMLFSAEANESGG